MINIVIEKILRIPIAHAQLSGSQGGSRGVIDNPINVNTLADFIDKLLEIVVQVGLPVLVVAVVYVGFLFVSARGSEDGLKKAKSSFLTVVIGAAIVLGAFVISSAIKSTVDSLG